MKLSMIVAVDKNGGIGKDNNLPWHCPEDFAYFKAVTAKDTLVMGMNTYRSLPMYPKGLPDRNNLVVCRDPKDHNTLEQPNVTFVTLEDVQESEGKAWLLGGSNTFNLLKDQVVMVSITTILGDYTCDTFIDVPSYTKGKTLVDTNVLSDTATVTIHIDKALANKYTSANNVK
jgi:dihydrofolate reductase